MRCDHREVYRYRFFFTAPAHTEIYTLTLHDALPIFGGVEEALDFVAGGFVQLGGDLGELVDAAVDVGVLGFVIAGDGVDDGRSEEHTSELQSRFDLVCRLLLEKKKISNCFRGSKHN